jgi:hypothetical protein
MMASSPAAGGFIVVPSIVEYGAMPAKFRDGKVAERFRREGKAPYAGFA